MELPTEMVPHLAGRPYQTYARSRADGGVHQAVKPGGGAQQDRGQADLVADYAAQIPVIVICDLLGIPGAEGADFQAYTRSLMTPFT